MKRNIYEEFLYKQYDSDWKREMETIQSAD